jgi:hypothetical protein
MDRLTSMASEPTVVIHGANWRLADIRENIAWAKTKKWTRAKWKPRAALVGKLSKTKREYYGQAYNPQDSDLIPEGWNHDHCEICCWTLHFTDKEADGIGYASETFRQWLCSECYDLFVKETAETP